MEINRDRVDAFANEISTDAETFSSMGLSMTISYFSQFIRAINPREVAIAYLREINNAGHKEL